jgi:deoxyribodipyrimidine photo-lyase
MRQPLIIYWSRRDFRLTDNPALEAALTKSRTEGIPFLPLFILEDYMTNGDPAYQFGYTSRQFLSRALPKFREAFKLFALVEGKAAQYLTSLNTEYDLTIFVNDDVYPDFYTQIRKLTDAGVRIEVLPDALTVNKETKTGEGNLYSVFTPFKKSVWASVVAKRNLVVSKPREVDYLDAVSFQKLKNRLEVTEEAIWEACAHTRLLSVGDTTLDLDTLTKPPRVEAWYASEDEALGRFDLYLAAGLLDGYGTNRDSLEHDSDVTVHKDGAIEGKTSRMSLALAWGLVSSRTLIERIQKHFDEAFDNPFSNRVSQGALTYISELIWREFYRYQLFHHPELMHTEFQERFRGTITWIPKDEAIERFKLWIQGKTGYPVVDAAMHQLGATGWMHNRARMIVASILTKNLGVDWRWGQEYFRAVLIDLDEASNNGGWQWGASVGADPKPIRIFNPYLQAKNYDASGAYVERWLSSGDQILKEEVLPIVEHTLARDDALRRYGLSKVEPRDY